MKNGIRLALIYLAATAAPAFAQSGIPQCGTANFDRSQKLFTIVNRAADTVNQQCLITVYPQGSVPMEARMDPTSYYPEGTYVIEMSGGGGGGAGGATLNRGGGSGGSGAAPSRTVQYLSPGVYKLTIGTGGQGATAGGSTYGGNPSSLTMADTGAYVAGTFGADTAKQVKRAPQSVGQGGAAPAGGSFGGDGGDAGYRPKESPAEAGGESQTPGYAGVGGSAGRERAGPKANAGGGGGAGVGNGGIGESRDGNTAGGNGTLGGGGAGGRGGFFTAHSGGDGGDGFIRLSMSAPAQPVAVAVAAPVEVIQPVAAAVPAETPAPAYVAPARARKQDRN